MFVFGGCKKKKAQIPYPDYATPKNAAVTFARAMERDDVKVAQESSVAGGMEVELVEAMCHATHALKELGKLAHEKFGEDAERTLRGAGSIDASEALAAGEVTFDGDARATVNPTVGQAIVPVQKNEDDDLWKVDVGALIKGDDVTRAIPLLKVVATAAAEVQADLAGGKLKNIDETKTALMRRITAAAGKQGVSTSMPTSLPVRGVEGM
jgi:hypothetical protein